MPSQERPNFKSVRQKIKQILALDKLVNSYANDRAFEQNLQKATSDYIQAETDRALKALPIEELNRNKLGIRVSALRAAGIYSIYDVINYRESELLNIYGIGSESAYKIVNSASAIKKYTRENVRIRLSYDNKTRESSELVKSLYAVKNFKPVRDRSSEIYKYSHSNISAAVKDASKAKNIFAWILSNGHGREQAMEGIARIDTMLNGKYSQQIAELNEKRKDLKSVNTETAWDDFLSHAAVYNTILANHGRVPAEENGNEKSRSKKQETGKHSTNRKTESQEKGTTRNGLPIELADKVEGVPLNTEGMKSELRGYQKLGAQYALSQGNVLLGDEMGLGKSIQAIAVMTSLKNDGEKHFLVVCPASVLINWSREIYTHSSLNPVIIHGSDSAQQFDLWRRFGGVAVTNYENCGKFNLDRYPEFRYALLVADEAHYIKNPKANRTANLLELKKRADRALFMTGTPLENNVNEMVFLIKCLNPFVGKSIENYTYFSSSQEFRNLIAPVYFRRKREDVLQELPDKEEVAEWNIPNRYELEKYSEATYNRKFAEMRRVSWNVDDIRNSTKAARLLELCDEAAAEGRKLIVFSFFLKTIDRVVEVLGDRCYGPITGAVSPAKRQDIIDAFTNGKPGSAIICQIQAGGTGLNIQAASVVVFCEPQLKPSIENQAISRAYRMGQSRKVLVYRLLCDECVDEHIVKILAQKQDIFNEYADESVSSAETAQLDEKTCNEIIDKEIARLKRRTA